MHRIGAEDSRSMNSPKGAVTSSESPIFASLNSHSVKRPPGTLRMKNSTLRDVPLASGTFANE